MTCITCDAPLIKRPRRKITLPDGHRFHAGRGLCSTCYDREKKLGFLSAPKATYKVPAACTALDGDPACKCKWCKEAAKDDDFDAGPSYVGRHGVRRWVG